MQERNLKILKRISKYSLINLGDKPSLSFLSFFLNLCYVFSISDLVHGWNLSASESTLCFVLKMRFGMNVPKSLADFILNSSENSGWQQMPLAPEVDAVGASMGGFLVILFVWSLLCFHCKDRWGTREPSTMYSSLAVL